ncbi:piRNA biogenesis protein EXD1 [Pygocentrus nattereri]|uniref:3'-5' exonuclease domain-containing protein n=1 Tax=Pygocentrus nattereri TaxID=42514 RepID=A0A3B4BVP3_PYGNA|nr:piRNA biogenesis protein EXD1 [Pygocentrus nattereri]
MASLDDYHFLEGFKRKQIKLTTRGSTFIGVVQRINLNKTIILEDVVEVKSGRKLPGAKLFFGHEVLNIEFPSVSREDDEGNSRDHASLGRLCVAEFQPYKRGLMLDDEDEEHVNYVVVDEFHEKFGPAVMHIKKQQVVGIGADGVGVFQHERLCWLQIATKNKVYLFDILLLGGRAFKNGLSMILESNHILKVTHDCRCIAGCLLAQFGVNLTNVFDTQVADIMHFYSETGGFLPDRVSTLQEVVSFHLKMPLRHLSSLRIKTQLAREDNEVWYVRPCPVPLLKVMALSVIHLQPLRLVLLDALMSDYTNLVDSYLSSSQDEPVHTQHIGKSVLELPKELRELEVIRQGRQEWAVNHYPVTENGLLERYNVKPSLEPSDPQSVECPGPEETACTRPSLLEGESALLKTSATHLTRARSAEDLTDFTALGRGKPPDKESASITTSVPVLGRGFTVLPPVEDPRERLLHKESELVVPDGLDSVSQPISIMAGVAQRGSHPATPLSLGRGLFNTPISLASPRALSFSSSWKPC